MIVFIFVKKVWLPKGLFDMRMVLQKVGQRRRPTLHHANHQKLGEPVGVLGDGNVSTVFNRRVTIVLNVNVYGYVWGWRKHVTKAVGRCLRRRARSPNHNTFFLFWS